MRRIWLPRGRAGRIVGTVIGGLLIGVLLSRTYSGWVGEVFGWRAVFASATVLMVVMATMMWRWLPDGPPTSQLSWPKLIASIGPLWREHAVLREAVAINSLMFCVFSGFWTSMVFFVEAPPYNYTSRGAGFFGLIGAAGALCAPFAGKLTDKHGGHRNVLYAIAGMLIAFAIMGFFGTNLAGFIVGIIVLDLAQQFGHVSNQTAHLRAGTGGSQPPEHGLHDVFVHRRIAGIVCRHTVVEPLWLVGRVRFFDGADGDRAGGVVEFQSQAFETYAFQH
ncbi:MAG: MFS transporter [Acidobacteriota bacterium]